VESALPLLLLFHEQGVILTVERIKTYGSNDRDSRIQSLAANALFDKETHDKWTHETQYLSRYYVRLYSVFVVID
jgi:hypothetical protein